MATIPELLDGHITLEVECLDRLYLNGYIGKLATGPVLLHAGSVGEANSVARCAGADFGEVSRSGEGWTAPSARSTTRARQCASCN
jgi:hypothetical protein